MKTIICHPNAAIRTDLRQQLTKLDHVVVHEDPNVDRIITTVAKHRPHFVVAAEGESFLRCQVESVFCDLALHVPILWLPDSEEPAREKWLADEISRLVAGIGPRPLTRYADDSRQVIRDLDYAQFENGAKQNLPDSSENPKHELAREMAVFARQAERATEHHAAARHYLRQALLTHNGGLRREATYRAVHGSHKGLGFLREEVFRWAGVLSFYVPGVQPVYLPPAAPPSPKLEFLHHSSPPENYYAATALLLHGFRPSWMQALQSVLSMKFIGQDDAKLLTETLALAGWSALLRDIAMAQVRVMGCALDPSIPWYKDGLPPRRLHRATGIYCDFWHLRNLRENPQRLRPVADGVLQGVKTPGTLPVVPPFRHFVQALGQGASSLPPSERKEG
jgi:hypothetical protein